MNLTLSIGATVVSARGRSKSWLSGGPVSAVTPVGSTVTLHSGEQIQTLSSLTEREKAVMQDVERREKQRPPRRPDSMVSSSPVPASSPELDRFLTAMLRAVGGTLVINPMDSIIGTDEAIKVSKLDNGCYKYEIVERKVPTSPPPPFFHRDPVMAGKWTDPDTGEEWTANLDPVGWWREELDDLGPQVKRIWMPNERWR